MQEAQGSGAFAYPRRPPATQYGARVNYAAREYWEPGVPDDYRPRGRRNAEHPSDPDIRSSSYQFRLKDPEGRRNAFQALMMLFEPQSLARRKTLIHCDRFVSLVHFRSYAANIGERDFNERVLRGVTNFELRYDGLADISAGDRMVPRGGVYPGIHLCSYDPQNRGDFVVGDHVIFFNHPRYDDLMVIAGQSGVWRLEHAILIVRPSSRPEDDVFLGHGSGARTELNMRNKLRREFNIIANLALPRLRRDWPGVFRDWNAERPHGPGLTRPEPDRFLIGSWQVAPLGIAGDIPGLYSPTHYPDRRIFSHVRRPAQSL